MALDKSPGSSRNPPSPPLFLLLGLHVFTAPANVGEVLTFSGSGADYDLGMSVNLSAELLVDESVPGIFEDELVRADTHLWIVQHDI